MKYVHIGFSRTGTTWLQRLVFPEWMKDNNVAFFREMKTPDFHQTPSDKILISNENIGAHFFFKDTIANALKNMLYLFGDVKVIISSRDLDKVARSIYYSLITSFGVSNTINNQKIRKIANLEVGFHHVLVFEWLDKNKVPYTIIDIDYFLDDSRSLAEFMDISPPTDEQVRRWTRIRINKSLPRWVLFMAETLHKLNFHRMRKVFLRLTMFTRT